MSVRTCWSCGAHFILGPTKPGNIIDCEQCAIDPARPFRALVSYPSKNASEVEIVLTQNLCLANAFAKAQHHHWSKAF